jgi:hypothetical protein
MGNTNTNTNTFTNTIFNKCVISWYIFIVEIAWALKRYFYVILFLVFIIYLILYKVNFCISLVDPMSVFN